MDLLHNKKEIIMEELDKYFSGDLDPKIQYASREQGIKAFAEEYSFNTESELYNQLTKEQQALWRKEIEQACISGGEEGIELANDRRYKENLEAKEVDLEKELDIWRHNHFHGRRDKDASGEYLERSSQLDIANHFFELGLKAQIMTSKLQQRISVLKMSFWTGLQTFEETEMTLSDAYNQGIDDILEELGLKAQKGE